MPSILGANSVSGYNISNSLRFNDDDSAALSITPSSASTSRKKWTWSGWIKRGEVPTDDNNDYSRIFNVKADGNNYIISGFLYSGGFNVTAREGNTEVLKFEPSRKFRDHSAWTHIVMAYDSTLGTARNRFRVYFNGEEDTTALDTTPDQNTELVVLEDVIHNIGRDNHGTAYYYDGYMADVYLIDGTQYAASDFGETDDNGVWIPKNFAGSFGTNGFKLEFQQTGTSQNASGIGADTSGNDNHLAVTNLAATDVTTDTPTNNFMTMNPLFTNSRGAFAEGNLKVTTNVQGSVPYGQVEFGNFAVNKGKWYYEAKVTSVGSGGSLGLGWNERAESGGYTNGHNNGGSAGNVRYNSGGVLGIGSSHSQSTGVDSFTDNDIIGFALDLDNNKVYAYKNGNPQDDPTPDPDDNDGRAIVSAYNNYWTPWMSKDDTNHNATVEFNFGNSSFSISSGNADGNGYGNFEYAVPSGYYSLCTKNLAEFG